MLVVKLLKEEKTWADKVLLTCTLVAAVYGLLQMTWNVWHAADSWLHPKLVNAVVNSVNLQFPQYDDIQVTFLNPTDITQSMDQVEFACIKGSTKMMLYPANDFTVPVQPAMVLMPMALGAGVTRRVDFLLPKFQGPSATKGCESLQVYWLDAERKMRSGDVMNLPKDAPFVLSGMSAKD